MMINNAARNNLMKAIGRRPPMRGATVGLTRERNADDNGNADHPAMTLFYESARGNARKYCDIPCLCAADSDRNRRDRRRTSCKSILHLRNRGTWVRNDSDINFANMASTLSQVSL